MPSTRGTFYKCNHKGWGGSCHRCDFADKLEAMAKAGEIYITNKRTDNPTKWTKEEMLEEVIAKKGYAEVFRRAVYGMLPGNKIRERIIKNLEVTE